MPVYDKDGNEVDILNVLSPEEIKKLVVQTEPYQEVLAESIQRRKALKEAKQTAGKALETANEPDEPEKPVTPVPPAPVVIDPEAVTAKVLETLDAREKAKAAREELITRVLAEAGLKSTSGHFRTIIGAASDEASMKNLAEALKNSGLQFDAVPGGNGKTDVDAEGLMANVKKKVFKNTNP